MQIEKKKIYVLALNYLFKMIFVRGSLFPSEFLVSAISEKVKGRPIINKNEQRSSEMLALCSFFLKFHGYLLLSTLLSWLHGKPKLDQLETAGLIQYVPQFFNFMGSEGTPGTALSAYSLLYTQTSPLVVLTEPCEMPVN